MVSSPGCGKDQWHTDDSLANFDMRADIARMEVYRYLLLSKGPDTFYLEEVFNRFISLAQVPLNFAIFDMNANDRSFSICFHFMNDVKYFDSFSDHCRGMDYDEVAAGFQFFPQIFENKRVIIFRMNTKIDQSSGWFSTLSPSEDDRDRDYDSIARQETDLSKERCLQRMAWRFFEDYWDGFHTDLSQVATEYFSTSFDKLASNSRARNPSGTNAWPLNLVEKKLICNIQLPVVGPVLCQDQLYQSRKSWSKTIHKVFEDFLPFSEKGLRAQDSLMHEGRRQYPASKIPNMILAYRMFTRDTLREDWNVYGNGYCYDIQFLAGDDSGYNFYSDFFEELKNQGREVSCLGENGAFGENPRILYSEFLFKSERTTKLIEKRFSCKKEDPLYEAITLSLDEVMKLMDDYFWETLRGEGVDSIIQTLSAPLGKQVRSIFDPVIHTGLIHINPVFELGGLDRVGMFFSFFQPTNNGRRRRDFVEKYFEANKQDLLRITCFYYLFCEMASWGQGGLTGDFDPVLLNAILIPVKMRGAVWGVSAHASYPAKGNISDPSHIHKSTPYWMANYNLMTVIKAKNQDMIDNFLWRYAERKVSDILAKHIMCLNEDDGIGLAFHSFNSEMDLLERTLPYALPRMAADETDSSDSIFNNYVEITGNEDETYEFRWRVKDNSFFIPPQKWVQKGSRSFGESIRRGISKGSGGV